MPRGRGCPDSTLAQGKGMQAANWWLLLLMLCLAFGALNCAGTNHRVMRGDLKPSRRVQLLKRVHNAKRRGGTGGGGGAGGGGGGAGPSTQHGAQIVMDV